MEPGAVRLPPQVLGEREALQQFFSDQDVSDVLDSSVAVDTSILEQFLGNDMDPSSFMLPDSPPESEACSPAQIPDFHVEPPYWSSPHPPSHQLFHPTPQPAAATASCRFKDYGSAPNPPELLTYNQLRNLGLTNTHIKAGGTPPIPPSARPPPQPQPQPQPSPEHRHHLSPESCPQVYTPPTPPSPSLPPPRSCAGAGGLPHVTTPASSCLLSSASSQHAHPSESRKRRRSECEDSSSGVEASCSDADGSVGGSAANGAGLSSASYQLLTWQPYRAGEWSSVLDGSRRTLSPPDYHVDTDKGFNYSASDEAFICQKKNHFQVTIHIGVAAQPRFVGTLGAARPVDRFHIKVFGIKLEAPSHQVTIEQSQPDRSKKPFHPVSVELPAGKVTKVTLGRLHFSETTANNMRKKGKPNPDQRYFQMVVGLYAAVGGDSFLLTALVSERIIVRASNPGQFEMEGDTLWQRGAVQDSVFCPGRVGINTDSPDEALVVCGNAKVMGAIMQPSDGRVKENIQQVDSQQQLKRITQMRIVEFDYKPEFASTVGIDHTHQTGIIAQEVKQLIPSAVREVGDVSCSDGEMIHQLLMVDKDQIFMENVGAVQQLSKLTDNLEERIKDLEVWNRRLAKLKSLTGSLRSAGKSRKQSGASSSGADTAKSVKVEKEKGRSHKHNQCLQHKVLQASVFSLITTMAFCIISITALYLLNLEEEGPALGSGNTSVSVQTTAWTSTVSPTEGPAPWPPDVDFCDLLYCDQVHCCPAPAGGSFNINTTGPATKPDLTAEMFLRQLEGIKDWRNSTIQSFRIKENQQVIDNQYCLRDDCGPGRFVFRVPISPFVPVNMRVTLLMNSTELLVVYLCALDESSLCSALLDVNTQTGSRYPSNTQGEHEWPLHVARLYHGSYHFRSTVAGQADCSTDNHYAGALFTDYIFHFYRHCTDSPSPKQIPTNISLE